MRRIPPRLFVTVALALLSSAAAASAAGAERPAFTRHRDVVYGRKYGVLLRRGYTVFAVVHGSQPKFTIPEILQDMNRAFRFIRHHAADYKIDPGRVGVYGGSAGGHLSLMQGLAGDADVLVPIQQAQVLVEKLKAAGVEAAVTVKPGAGHGWPDQAKDMILIADWFDAHLGSDAKREEGRAVFEDSFDGAALKEGWNWHRESAGNWRLAEGALEIRVEPGRGETVKNVLWRDAPDRTKGAYVFEVTVTNKAAPTNQWEQAGLIFYRAGVPAVKLGKELVDGKLCVIPGEVPMDARTVRLRLTVKGDDYVAQYQPDAKGEFKTAGAGRLIDGGKLPAAGNLPAEAGGGEQVSLQCFEGPADAEHWVRFDDFRITEVDNLPVQEKR